jgi:hypothetical protein
MEHVIDPQPHGNIGGFGKVDFLQARTFLKAVKFSHRPALNELIDQLAIMFSARYETKPDAREPQHATKMLQIRFGICHSLISIKLAVLTSMTCG